MENLIPTVPCTPIDLPGNDYPYFEDAFEKLAGIRLNLYKEKQMKRRINTLIERKKLHTYSEFVELLESSTAELEAFINYITINVTEFFRTPEQWKEFENETLADLAQNAKKPLRIWSCACATGEEPYSLAMSLTGYVTPENFSILATDIDEEVLEKAKAACYDERAMETLPEVCRNQFFTRSGTGWQLCDEIRSRVDFRRLDLLQDDFPADCDLIVCRNVLIYFTEEAKQMLYEKFLRCLKPGGYLFTGNTEQIIYYKSLGYQKRKNFLYRKP